MKATGTASSEPAAGEHALVRAAQDGNSEAFAQLYDLYVERVFRYVYFRVSDDRTAEDVTSEVFLKAWENLAHYQSRETPFIAWLYRIAHHTVIDHYRASRASIPLEEVGEMADPVQADLEDGMENHIQSAQLRRSIQRLTREQQQVVILKFVVGLSTQEIARQMGKRQGAVRALQMRALKALAQDLGWMEWQYEEL